MYEYRIEPLKFWPKVEDWNWETIFCGHYTSVFNHYAITPFNVIQGHSTSSRSISIVSPYATSY